MPVSQMLFRFVTSMLLVLGLAQHALAAVVLQYHHIDEETPALTSISPDLFQRHIEYLVDNQFEVISTQTLAELLKAKDAKLNNPDVYLAVITFDDGYSSVLNQALPILKKHNLPFTVFVNPQLVGKRGYMSWDELRYLQKQGAEIANHTLSHPHLIRKLPDETDKQWRQRVRQEVVEAEKILDQKLDKFSRQLAYPYGEFNQEIRAIVKELGYIAYSQHSGAVGTNSDLHALPRFAFGGEYGELSTFKDKANSLPMSFVEWQALDQNGKTLIDPLLPDEVTQPTLSIRVTKPLSLNCFASGQGRIAVEKLDDLTYLTRADKPLPVGRSRYNCTAPSGVGGRFYWLSQPFYRKKTDGSWYAEY